MVLDTKKYELIYGAEWNRPPRRWKLSKSEMKFIKLLLDNEVHSKAQIKNRCSLKGTENVSIYIYRIKKKIPTLEIETINGLGYRLDTCIKVQ